MKFKSNRIIAVLLSVITIISAIPITVSAEEADLKISTLSEFQQFAADVNNGNTYEGKTVVLNADIALGGESSPWTPIGNETNRFKGTFNGENHVVSGLFISDSSGKNLGLFGYVENGAVESLTVKGSVYGSGNVAGIVGYPFRRKCYKLRKQRRRNRFKCRRRCRRIRRRSIVCQRMLLY